MKQEVLSTTGVVATLKDVADRIALNEALSDSRKRDLRSALSSYGRLLDTPLAEIALDLATIRRSLDQMMPAQAKISRKRWANLRSDLAAAIAASGLHPMLQTAGLDLNASWQNLLGAAKDKAIGLGLSRLARWASARQTRPEQIDNAVLERFFAELEAASLVRNLKLQRRTIAKCWNRLVMLLPELQLRAVEVPASKAVATRVAWADLPISFRQDRDNYLRWRAVPDPLDEQARARRLAPATLRLRRDY